MKLRNIVNRQLSVEMGQSDAVEYVNINDQPSSPGVHGAKKVSILPLIFLIFYEVSGGPFGVEDSVKSAGPLLALLGFLVFPIIWSVPQALITAEMGTMFPENGGYVVWVSSALGPYWGFQQGWMKWLSGVIDNALYPVLPYPVLFLGLVLQPCLKYAEKKRLMKFSTSTELPDLHGPEQESVDSLPE